MSTALPVPAARSHRKSWEVAAAHPMVRVRRIGYAVLTLQLAVSLAWSSLLYSRFATTFDFSMFQQAWVLIAHGNLNPYNTIKDIYFWQDHTELFMWPIALLYWVWPHGVTLLWVQDICVVAAEAVAFTWICELAQRRRPGIDARWLACIGLLLLVANPWIWWSISWDFHSETTAMPFALLLAWDLYHGRRRAWLWVLPLLSNGDVAATYVAAIGLGALLRRGFRVQGLVLVAAGVIATAIITLIHGNLGSGGGLQAYAYLVNSGKSTAHLGLGALARGIAQHPGNVASELWSKRADIWANTAPSGPPGFGFLWLLPMVLNIVTANNLFAGLLFAAPGFQSLPLYIFLPVGTVAVLAIVGQRRRRIALVLCAFVVVQAVGYAVIWLPRTPGQWLRVPAATAATLAHVQAQIPNSAEVIASQGVMGPFAGRLDIRPLFGPGSIPVQHGQLWIVITPTAGIETLQTSAAMALTAELAGPLHATLVTRANGVWAFRWSPPAGVRELSVPSGNGQVNAWPSPGVAGRAVLTSQEADWHVASTGSRGYVTNGLQWREKPGKFQATVRLSATGPVNVEVWNDNCGTLLARRTVASTTVENVSMPVNATAGCQLRAYSGWSIFHADFIPPPSGQLLEVRVWSPGDETVNVYRAALTAAR